ncbi:MAG: ATP-binding protein [Acholeplasmataceae bacterium]|jgi:hypothetical protein|nr:ATP-binding protein [Acholeplasmataceae bacterium]
MTKIDYSWLVSQNNENECLDFKEQINFNSDRTGFLKDVVAFANSDMSGDKYIVYGVKDKPIELVGLDFDVEHDFSEFYEFLSTNVEPKIPVRFDRIIQDDKKFLVLIISGSVHNRPYILKRDYKKLFQGDCFIRYGTRNSRCSRSDFDNFQKTRIDFKTTLTNSYMYIIDYDPAKIEMKFDNHSNVTLSFVHVYLEIYSHDLRFLTDTRMFEFKSSEKHQKSTNGEDFHLLLESNQESIGTASFSFSTSQAGIIGLDEDGVNEHPYKLRLLFYRDTDSDPFIFDFLDCTIFGKGAILRKVIGLNKRI